MIKRPSFQFFTCLTVSRLSDSPFLEISLKIGKLITQNKQIQFSLARPTRQSFIIGRSPQQRESDRPKNAK